MSWKRKRMIERLRRNDLHDLELDNIDVGNNGIYPQVGVTLSDWVQAICMNAICEQSKVRNVSIRQEFLDKLETAEVGTLIELLGGFPQLQNIVLCSRDSSGRGPFGSVFYHDDDHNINANDDDDDKVKDFKISIPAWALTGILHPSRQKLETFITSSLNLMDQGGDLRLSKALEGHKSLTKLTLRGLSLAEGKLSEEGLDSLFKSLNTCSSLKEICISLEHQQSLSDTSVDYITNLCNLPNLQMLKLDNIQFNTKQMETFCRALKGPNTSSLSRLHISRCDLSGKQGVAIGHMLRVNTSLETLDLSDSHVDDEGCVTIAHALASTNASLQELDLRNNKSPAITSSLGAFALGAMLTSNQSLTSLALSFQGQENNAFIAFSKVLSESNSALKKLDLRNDSNTEPQQCRITSTTDGSSPCSLMAKMLKSNKSIEHFALSLHSLDDDGCTAIAEALEENSVLRTLDIRKKSPSLPPYESKVTSCGYKALAQMLKRNTVIESLLSDAKDSFKVEIESLLAFDRKILNQDNATRADWIETMGSSSDNLETLYYLVSLNPSLCAGVYEEQDNDCQRNLPSFCNKRSLLALGVIYVMFQARAALIYLQGSDDILFPFAVLLQWLYFMSIIWSFIFLSNK